MRTWKALVLGGAISEVGWLSLCGAPPPLRRFRVARCGLVVGGGRAAVEGSSPGMEAVHGDVVDDPPP